MIQILSYFLIALYSCYFAWKRLRREGMKPEVRMMFIKKQIAYVIVNLMMWVCFFINAIYRLYLLRFKKPDQKIVKWVEYIQTLSILSAIITGLLFAGIRFFEPYLLFLIKK